MMGHSSLNYAKKKTDRQKEKGYIHSDLISSQVVEAVSSILSVSFHKNN